ncbi:secreted antigen 1 [Babesia caballi]|uniref:Secreted antigen 1 n=1 Tax=Babesia caballi TaxID=5871 RepID=A0AAV4LLA7_BABCB|nr:secreted antigen 1 [Babesia caballi]
MSGDCDDIQPPQTLKDALEFLAALNENVQLKEKVEEQLKTKAGIYFKQDLQYNVKNINTIFESVLQNSVRLRNDILGTPKSVSEKYCQLQRLADCDENCLNRLCGFMSKLNATLCYLLFNVDLTFQGCGGGQWATVRCNDRGYLCEWLTNHTGTSSHRLYNDQLLPGGYERDELSSRAGNELTESLRSLVKHDSGGHVQNMLLYLLFIYDWWDYSDTATTCAFLGAFCEEVIKKDGIFENNVKNCPNLENVCRSMKDNLEQITGNAKSASLLVAMYQESVENYRKLLKGDAFDSCVKVLIANLGVISNAATNIHNGCRSWSEPNVTAATSAGPFPYGFMFGEAWKNGGWNTAKQRLHAAIKRLYDKGFGDEGSLQDLIDALNHRSGSSSHGSGNAQNPGSSEPGSDGPRKPGSSGTESASSSTIGSSTTATATYTSATNSEGTTPASSGGGESANDRGNHSGHGNYGHPSGTPQAADESSVSGGSTVTIGSAAGGVALLGGGGAALYFLNVGGIKTLITGVP